MKTRNILALFVFTICAANPVFAAQKSSNKKINVSDDIDSLGGNKELMEMAQNIKSETRSRIVQDRIVERRNRVEFGLSYGGVFGGDSYTRTQALGVALDYHITPRWSLGARYYDYSNTLTDEGKRIFDQAAADKAAGVINGRAVDIDYAQNAMMAVVNWYPIYGKTSFLDMGVTQFDMYLLAGGGQMTLSSGTTGLYTGGIGVAAWISKHFSSRAELRYQTYQDNPVTGGRQLDTVVASLGFGFIL